MYFINYVEIEKYISMKKVLAFYILSLVYGTISAQQNTQDFSIVRARKVLKSTYASYAPMHMGRSGGTIRLLPKLFIFYLSLPSGVQTGTSAVAQATVRKTAPFPNNHRSPQADAALLAGISFATSNDVPLCCFSLIVNRNNSPYSSVFSLFFILHSPYLIFPSYLRSR